MSNLKKILALVLALVMSMSLVTVASADYADEDQIDARYAEAVEVLSDMGIFKGYNGGESFGPKALITREEVATMMYRVISTDVKDTNKGLFVEACNFSDVNNGRWSEGFIGYCFNGNYVKGYEDGTFRPTANVTGYEVLAMILRAVGYDQNGEFSGANWKKNIGTYAQQLGILDNVAPTVVLSQPATRELVAELIFKTIATVDKVEYTPAFSYQPIVSTILKMPTTIGMDNFNLVKGNRTEIDNWGRPGYYWTFNCGTTSTCIEEAYISRYTNAVTECQLYYDLNGTWTGNETVKFFVNGDYKTYSYTLESTDYVETLGGQGTQLELYADRIVMIETWLAEVTNVTKVVKDEAGHVITKARLYLSVYDQGYNVAPTTLYLSSYSDYSWEIGDYLLVNCDSTTNHVDANNRVVHDYVYYGGIVILGEAPSKIGAQTYIWYNADKHTIDGVDYNDAEWFCLDKAGNSPAQFNWLFDQFGNVIGAVELPAAAPVYGILESIQWINPVGAAGYAQGTIRYTDGSTELKKIYAIDNDASDATAAQVLTYLGVNTTVTEDGNTVSDNYAENTALCNKHLYRITEGYYGLTLTHVNTEATNGTITNNELTAAYIYNGGYEVKGAEGSQYINDDTVFMVKKAGAWTLVKGYKTISNYSNVEIDWLNTDSDPYIEFAFVIGSADNENGTGLWFRTNASYRHHITANGVLCEVTGIVDGVQKTLVEGYHLCGTNMYDLYELNYTNGAVSGQKALAHGDVTAAGYTVAVIEATNNATKTTWDGIVLNDTTDGVMYNVIGVETPTFGTWEANMGDHEIWVLYKDRTNADGTVTHIAGQVYIVPSAGLNGDGNAQGTVTPNNNVTFSVNSFTYVNNAFVMGVTSNAAVDGTIDIVITDAYGTVVAYSYGVALANGTSWTLSQPATVVSGATYTMTVSYSLTGGNTAADTVQTIIVH